MVKVKVQFREDNLKAKIRPLRATRIHPRKNRLNFSTFH